MQFSPKGIVSLYISAIASNQCDFSRITESSRQTVLAVHLQSVWSFDASKVGLVFLAALVPTLIGEAPSKLALHLDT